MAWRSAPLRYLLLLTAAFLLRQTPQLEARRIPMCSSACNIYASCTTFCQEWEGDPPRLNTKTCQMYGECADLCGDGICSETEDSQSCVADCGYCGDGQCYSPAGEDRDTCPNDCGYCGDGICQDVEAVPGSWCVADCGEEPTGTCGECDHKNDSTCPNGDTCDLYDCCDTPDACSFQNGASCIFGNECCEGSFVTFRIRVTALGRAGAVSRSE